MRFTHCGISPAKSKDRLFRSTCVVRRLPIIASFSLKPTKSIESIVCFPDSYSLPHGVFLFLGYSEMDENLLKPHINLTIQDSVEALQHVIRFEPPSSKVTRQHAMRRRTLTHSASRWHFWEQILSGNVKEIPFLTFKVSLPTTVKNTHHRPRH